MGIDRSKLQKVVVKPNGDTVAQCPACVADGSDGTGNHLIIYPTGQFGCVVNQGDREHNKKILALAGDGKQGTEKKGQVTVHAYKAPKSTVVGAVPRRSLEELGFHRKVK